ncbi:MAG: hypothetical protein ACI9P5_002900 [Saprospiraceae bacterium]|jgi:hypothetical protein|tara:strand:+ start:2474 stop:2611 length:138 start_codon:yes stop_codon:yes gene_type:complete
MFEYLADKLGEKTASFLMAIWYFGLLYLVMFFLQYEAGLFNYLHW